MSFHNCRTLPQIGLALLAAFVRVVKNRRRSAVRKYNGFVLGSLLAVGLLPAVAAAADQRVEVGEFTSAGTVALQLEKFHEHFADGTRIAEITVTEYNGNRVVKRKGYSASGDCRAEMTPLLDSNGQVIPSTFVAPAGTRVFLFGTAIPVNVSFCNDDGCHALKKAVALGQPRNQSAKCDQTELSGNSCKCHIVPAVGGTHITNGDFCRSWLESISSLLSDWVRFRYIL